MTLISLINAEKQQKISVICVNQRPISGDVNAYIRVNSWQIFFCTP